MYADDGIIFNAKQTPKLDDEYIGIKKNEAKSG